MFFINIISNCFIFNKINIGETFFPGPAVICFLNQKHICCFICVWRKMMVSEHNAKLYLGDNVLLSMAVMTQSSRTAYKLTQTHLLRIDKPVTERWQLKTLGSTFCLSSHFKSFDWIQQFAVSRRVVISLETSCNNQITKTYIPSNIPICLYIQDTSNNQIHRYSN